MDQMLRARGQCRWFIWINSAWPGSILCGCSGMLSVTNRIILNNEILIDGNKWEESLPPPPRAPPPTLPCPTPCSSPSSYNSSSSIWSCEATPHPTWRHCQHMSMCWRIPKNPKGSLKDPRRIPRRIPGNPLELSNWFQFHLSPLHLPLSLPPSPPPSCTLLHPSPTIRPEVFRNLIITFGWLNPIR